MSLPSLRRRVFAWFSRNSRELSWRGTRNPYEILVSEIMLQQTTVAAVEGYYRRFLQRFPNVESLAAAELTEVYRYWEGLGYYRRASQLHQAAGVIAGKHGGIFPQTFDEVLALPGVGRYTAGAVLSIAYDQRLPILEANTIRLHCRLLGLTTNPFEMETNKRLWTFAEEILPYKNVGRFNQALMDLGSRVCTLKQPQCLRETPCPLFEWCQAARLGLQREIPVPKVKPNVEAVTEIAVLVRKRGRILLVQYPDGVRWAGLWDFPRCRDDGFVTETLGELTGRRITTGRQIATHKHTVTRFKITLRFVEGKDCGPLSEPQYAVRWVTPEELNALPMNSSGRKLLRSNIVGEKFAAGTGNHDFADQKPTLPDSVGRRSNSCGHVGNRTGQQ